MHWEPWRAVFSTLCVIEGRPLFAAEHQAQMQKAAAVLGIPWTRDFTRHRLPHATGRLRWILSREQPEVLFKEETIRPPPIRLGSQSWDARFKTLSYLAHAQAHELAYPDEALHLNEHGQIASTATANIFWVKDGQLYSPAHEAGCREGIVRGIVAGRKAVRFGQFPITELESAEEVFLTNSLRGIVPVTQLESRPLQIGPITRNMMDCYSEEVKRQLSK
jgi:branched-subunit amino acid aminotransferase/4-amino-4-deoxychorismate lyase